jgi:hypothetical protein
MTKKDSEKEHAQENKDGAELTFKSLLAQAKGIEPLIIGVFIIVIYWFMSAIAFFLSWKFGRI